MANSRVRFGRDRAKIEEEIRNFLSPTPRVHIVYGTAESNKFFSIPVSIIRRRANLPPPQPGQPGPFSLGQMGVLETAFRAAGYTSVRSCTVAAPLLMESASECVRFEQESFGALHQMLSSLDADGKAAAWDEIDMQLQQFESSSGFSGPCEMIVAVGTK